MIAKETIVKKVARLLGLAATEGAGWTVAAFKVARTRTRAVLLEAASLLGLSGVSKLKKEDLARQVVDVLKEIRKAAGRATGGESTPAKTAAKTAARARPARAAPAAEPEENTTPPKTPPKAKAAPVAAASPPARTAKPAAPAAPAKAKAARPAPRPEAAAVEAAPVAAAPEHDPSSSAKLDLGPAGRSEAHVAQIPWGYGQDRVTAAAIDPDRLYAWWEVTDVAIELARQRLGDRGAHASLALRVFDTSGLIFDGSNAHSSFDHRIDRAARQWFFVIGKPTSSAYVELGLVADGGAFARIARSGRVDFPRKDAVAWAEPEWMTVIEGRAQHHGPAAGRGPDGSPQGSPPAGGGGAGGGPGGGGPGGAPGPTGSQAAGAGPVRWVTWVEGAAPGFEAAPLWILRQTATGRQLLVGERFEDRVEWREVSAEGWYQLAGPAEWQEASTVTSWEAGPFQHPVEVLDVVREAWQGRSYGYQVGPVTHVVHGPWEVVIKNLGASVSRSVVARWQIYRSWVTDAGGEVRVSPLGEAPPAGRPGASELLLAGASERRWVAASELRLGGASELWRLGASELRLRGASERSWLGGSERVAQGASERAGQRGSEARLAGGSEARLGGASEGRLGGGSEGRLGGASEARPAGPAGEPGGYPTVGEA